MNLLDLLIVFVYIAVLLGLGYYFKKQKSSNDYFLGGRSFGWFSMGLSTMASQLSAISFISAAAFVGMKSGGGMHWLSFEFAVPLAMVFLIVVIIPPLYKAGIISIYAYLEESFGVSTRRLISIVFQISRSFATGIMIYTVAIVLSAVMNIPNWQTILLSGLITIIYSYQGGMKAVIWGDVIQMLILTAGIFVCTYYGIHLLGGWDEFLAGIDPGRTIIVKNNWGVGPDAEFGIWPMIIGGFFLYISYYGCDQSQAQRSLSGRDISQVRKALMFNGILRFPITFLYCLMGLAIGSFARKNSDFMQLIPDDKPDYMVPLFIIEYLPHGLIGLLFVAILAAAMSSLSSAINSLSAASVEDIIVRGRNFEAHKVLRYSKWMTVFWGLVCITLAFSAGNIAPTVIEAINKVGSAFYGPIVACFLLAFFSRNISARDINIGIIAGVATNLLIWITGAPIFWIWWNFIGFTVTIVVSRIISVLSPSHTRGHRILRTELKFLNRENLVLILFFILILLISFSLPKLLN